MGEYDRQTVAVILTICNSTFRLHVQTGCATWHGASRPCGSGRLAPHSVMAGTAMPRSTTRVTHFPATFIGGRAEKREYPDAIL